LHRNALAISRVKNGIALEFFGQKSKFSAEIHFLDKLSLLDQKIVFDHDFLFWAKIRF